ncbi:hypothetical protein EPUS_09273 [Endocarpon pusillum Z07020]|uniref:Uncharacterized protein n=1 Tax=Endocarpon pusillum (strain Z07020 / HMAS-L-300199) TaxID=1263415 RepID=U1HXJ3_ENDPU|nr:uncharacterized protein EPUS_09273 [Endocarpon pusillum Z07020]ERF75550.1 hypothetical protein EPUS_09273 [Endocarpon pusillum Z07020]
MSAQENIEMTCADNEERTHVARRMLPPWMMDGYPHRVQITEGRDPQTLQTQIAKVTPIPDYIEDLAKRFGDGFAAPRAKPVLHQGVFLMEVMKIFYSREVLYMNVDQLTATFRQHGARHVLLGSRPLVVFLYQTTYDLFGLIRIGPNLSGRPESQGGHGVGESVAVGAGYALSSLGEALYSDFCAESSKWFRSVINGSVPFKASGAELNVVEALPPVEESESKRFPFKFTHHHGPPL